MEKLSDAGREEQRCQSLVEDRKHQLEQYQTSYAEYKNICDCQKKKEQSIIHQKEQLDKLNEIMRKKSNFARSFKDCDVLLEQKKAQIKENGYRLEELTKFEKQLQEEKDQECIYTELQKKCKTYIESYEKKPVEVETCMDMLFKRAGRNFSLKDLKMASLVQCAVLCIILFWLQRIYRQ